MNLRARRKILWCTAFTGLALTWVPYFGFLNTLTWIGPLPLPMAWILSINIVLTICSIFMYPVCFKPLTERLERFPLKTIEGRDD